MTLKYSILAVISSSFILASAGFATDSSAIDGKWKNHSCNSTDHWGKGYTKRTYEFDTKAGEALFKVKIYPTKDCTQKSFEYRIYTDFNSKVVSKSKKTGTFAVTYTNQTLRVKTDKVARQFNRDRVCGFSKWKVGKEYSVNGKSCLGMSVPKAGVVRKGSYDVSKHGDDLRIVFNNINGKKHEVILEKVED